MCLQSSGMTLTEECFLLLRSQPHDLEIRVNKMQIILDMARNAKLSETWLEMPNVWQLTLCDNLLRQKQIIKSVKKF